MPLINTRISDLVGDVERLLGDVDFYIRENHDLITSGLFISDDVTTARLMSGGPRIVPIDYLNNLDTSQVNVSTDDIDQTGAMGKLTATYYNALRHDLNWAWGTTDLTKMVTKFNDLGGVNAGVGEYWIAQEKKYAIASIKGALAAGGAALSIGSTATAFSDALVIDAEATAEEGSEEFDLMFVTHALRAYLKKEERNDFVPASLTNTKFDQYQGKKLISTNAFGPGVTVLAKSGSVVSATGVVDDTVAMEIERIAGGGTGGGASVLRSRRSIAVHPQGFSYQGETAPTLAELATAESWEMKAPAKNVGFRAILTTPTGYAS